MKISVTTDVSKLKHLLMGLSVKIPVASAAGVDAAMEEFKKDCLTQPPACPRDTGELADSHEVLPTVVSGSQIVGTLKVSGPYAASLHEGISRHGTPYKFKTAGTGAKWIQSKTLRHGRRYVKIVEKYVNRSL